MSANHHDTLRRFLFEAHPVRGEWVNAQATWQAVLKNHDYPKPVQDLLGQAVAAALIMTSTLKFEGRLTLQITGDAPLSLLVVQCTHNLHVRAVARFDESAELPSDFKSLVGEGQLIMTIETPATEKQEAKRYQGIVAVEGDHLAECLEGYFTNSEQLPTRLWLACNEQQAVGMLLQRLPEAQSPQTNEWQAGSTDEAWARLQMLTDTVSDEELLKWGVEELIKKLFHEDDVRLFDERTVAFRCRCDRARILSMFKSFSEEEMTSLKNKDGSVEVHCDFCRERYDFDEVDLDQANPASPDAPSSSSVH